MALGGLVEVRVSWPGYPHYLKKKKIYSFIRQLEFDKSEIRIELGYNFI